MVTKVIFLTVTGAGSWPVPSDWNSFNNTIECIGGGAGSGGIDSGGGGCDGAGGGAYSKKTNVALTPSGSAAYSVGAGGVAGDGAGGTSIRTWWSCQPRCGPTTLRKRAPDATRKRACQASGLSHSRPSPPGWQPCSPRQLMEMLRKHAGHEITVRVRTERFTP
jgi:hypothetical protein